jgi:hypothetical protein
MNENVIKHLLNKILLPNCRGTLDELSNIYNQPQIKNPKDTTIYDGLILSDDFSTGIDLFIVNEFKRNLYLNLRTESIGKATKIKIGKLGLNRYIFNNTEHDFKYLTNSNYEYLNKIEETFDFDMEEKGFVFNEIILKNDSYLLFDNETFQTKYCHKYSVYHNAGIGNDIFIRDSSSQGFKSLLDLTISELYTLNLFGKRFSKLTKKELSILKMYLI